MSVRGKLIVLVVFVAVVPLAVSAYQSLQIHQGALERAHAEMHASSATFASTIVRQRVEHSLTTLRTLARESISWPQLLEGERRGAMWLIYAQIKLGVVVSLLDEEGQGLGPSAYLSAASKEYPERPALQAATLEAFANRIPHASAMQDSEALGEAFDSAGLTILPVAFSVDAGSGQRWVVAVGLNLTALCRELGRLPDAHGLSLFDGQQHKICDAGAPAHLRPAAPELKPLLTKPAGSSRYLDPESGEVLAASASTFSDWRVVAQQPLAKVTAASVSIRNQAILWISIGVLAALIGGLVLMQSILSPLAQLTAGAKKIAAGELEFRLGATENDELGQLARSFDHMVSEIRKRDQEIRAWNEELQARVDKRTLELKETTAALLESRTIAAMASLGAGVAHEINNPLTGVLGMTQLLLSRARKSPDSQDTPLLESIEREAKRIQELVEKMSRLTESNSNEGMVDVSGRQLLLAIVTAEQKRLNQAGVTIEEDFRAGASNVLGNPYQLSELFQRVIDNSIKAMSNAGGTLKIRTQRVDQEWVEFCVEDTGAGIRAEHLDKVFEPFFTTKEGWQGEGLGLTLAYRIVEVHGGKIEVQSQWQKGTKVMVKLPAARLGAHMV